jgi:hypothetical protein
MTERSSEQRVELSLPEDDLILPFQAEHADVLGRLVKLGPTVDYHPLPPRLPRARVAASR